MRIRVIDVETTGIPSETETHALVEIGTCDLVQSPSGWRIEAPVSTLVNPGRKIPIEAMAVHHIRDHDVADAPSPDRALLTLGEGATYFCAHNIDFERKFYAGGETPWICTFKSALRVWPDAPSHSNQVLRYFLDVDAQDDFDPTLAMPPHRAGPDAYVTAFILRELIDQASIEDMVRWSSGPALLAKVGFGKHRGKRWSELAAIDRGYLEWIVDKSGMDDRDVRATAKHYLKIADENSNGGTT